ncbi:MAG TPA: TatD family hydrolase [Christensenellaceae bacterium]|jgi:TatD DNase family protein|nr:TatD family hydrolase [Christensenellaceae bacterium]
MLLFDSHCHLEDDRFSGDRDEVISRMRETGVVCCTCAGSDINTSNEILRLSKEYRGVYAACGVHPHEAKSVQADYLTELNSMLCQDKCVALGEIGLDYYYDNSPRILQAKVFIEQLNLAGKRDMPVIIHVRDAHGDAIEILKSHRDIIKGGIMHCFSGSVESAEIYLDLGLYISFAGPVTFKNAKKLQEVAKFVPQDRILIETDSPYLSPEPVRGRRNEPANVAHICSFISKLRKLDVEEFASLTFRNACNVYNIDINTAEIIDT